MSLTPHPSALRVPVLVESAEGYRNLCRLITRMKMRAPKGEGALTLDELDGQTRGLIALAGRELLGFQKYGVGGLIDPLVGVFGRGNVYVEIQRHLLRDEEADNRMLVDVAGHVSCADCRDQRRALRRSGRAAAVRRAHLHPSQDRRSRRQERSSRAMPSAI